MSWDHAAGQRLGAPLAEGFPVWWGACAITWHFTVHLLAQGPQVGTAAGTGRTGDAQKQPRPRIGFRHPPHHTGAALVSGGTSPGEAKQRRPSEVRALRLSTFGPWRTQLHSFC